MRRRTRPKVVWAPGTNSNSLGTFNRTIAQIGSFSVAAGADTSGVIEFPVIQDGIQSDALRGPNSLSDIENSGYRLRRIVGKIWIFAAQGATTTDFGLYVVTAGFIIRRTNPETGGSLAVASGAISTFDPTDIEQSGDPWCWRRSWLLANEGLTGARNDGVNTIPHQNFGPAYPGGATEGPHVDQKTARVVGPEERLFLTIGATPALASGVATTFLVVTDLRVLISMRPSIGNRRNASR